MIKSYEFQGKNVDKALEEASVKLQIPTDKIKHEVVTYGSTGIFGLVGTKKAIIKVFVEERPLKKENDRKTVPAEKKPSAKSPLEHERALSKEPITEVTGDFIETGIQILQQIADKITDGATISGEQTEDRVVFNLQGGDSSMLIGKRGQTLEAMQYILEKILNRKIERKIRILVDVEGYLDKRKENLQRLAGRLAEKAKRIKKPVTIGQMNAHDRRIVHIHLKDETEIRTQSIGDGYYRKLMIFPKKKKYFKKGKDGSTE